MRELSGRELEEAMRADEARRWRERAESKATTKREYAQWRKAMGLSPE
jgi:hypothetical protein